MFEEKINPTIKSLCLTNAWGKLLLIAGLFMLGFTLSVLQAGSGRLSRDWAVRTIAQVPLGFEVNQGQCSSDEVKFIARSGGHTLFFGPTDAVLTLKTWNRRQETSSMVFRIEFVGANPDSKVEGVKMQTGQSNYFIGSDPSQWHRSVPRYSRVRYKAVYPGVDLLFYGNRHQLEYDFILAPGADPQGIALRFQGAERVEIDPRGDLILHTQGGQVRQQRPLVYQEFPGGRRDISADYRWKEADQVGFRLGDYDPTRPLIIDPLLIYSTYLGGNLNDGARAVGLDASANVYVVGETASLDFPTENPVAKRMGGVDVFVTKFNASGSTLIYSTFLGGSDSDRGLAIAVDDEGDAYLTGETRSFDFPITTGVVQPFKGGGADPFVARLDAAGGQLIFSTYFGGFAADVGHGIAVDNAGGVYITGRTASHDFPTKNALQPVLAGVQDAFLSKLSESGGGLLYSTYLGGSGSDRGSAVAVDSSGSPYVAGMTLSADLPTVNPFQAVNRGRADGFVVKGNLPGSAFIYSTYLGGSGDDMAHGLVVDTAGNAYVTGQTNSTDFPVQDPIQQLPQGLEDAFVAKLSPSGAGVVHSTYLGGSGSDVGQAIALDDSGSVYVAGKTESADFPIVDPWQGNLAGGIDLFVSKLTASATSLAYSTYLGGSADDVSYGIAVNSAAAYVVGETNSSDFPTASFQETSRGGKDAFVVKLADARTLYFAQFGDGSKAESFISSQIILVNPASTIEATVSIEINDTDGNPMSVDLNGVVIPGRMNVRIPANGLVNLQSDGQGPLQSGSVVVVSDTDVAGFILYNAGLLGVAGVGESQRLKKFVSPIETGAGVNSGVAFMGLGQAQDIMLELRDPQGKLVATSMVTLGQKAQMAKLVNQFEWDSEPDLRNFSGTLTATAGMDFAVTAILLTPGEFATLPVVKKN